ncbi:2'-5' RNA ligase family protein [Aeromicrobium sp. CF4.19]|uniref:2'-5' RNA ligase family protein n=1 Tax=Aeromicrobium sp. CF4.19 TaxID=3373082 RepID=UPI003EE6519A
MAQSVEIVLDPSLDARVRREWEALRRVGLAGQADHTGASNAPHVTLTVATTLDDAQEQAVREAVASVQGLAVTLGGLLVFPGRRCVLSRAVVPATELLSLHARVDEAIGEAEGRPPTLRPGAWTPHVTPSRHLRSEDLDAAMRALAEEPRMLTGSAAGVRRWDSEARRTWSLTGPY